MARQGNYVNVSGGVSNPFKDVSSSLAGLSKSLLGQASEERERARLAQAEEENRRRYGLDRADTLAQRAAQNKQWQQGFDATQTQRQLENEIARKERERLAGERTATRDIIRNYSPADERRRAFEADEVLVDAFNKETDQFRTTGATNLYTDDALGRARREGVGEEFGVNRGLTQRMVPTGDKALEYRNYLLGVDEKELNPQARELVRNIKAQEEGFQSRKDKYITGAMPLYKGDASASLTRRIIDAGGSLSPEALKSIELLTSPLKTREELSAQAKEQQKVERAELDDTATALWRAAQSYQKGSKDGGSGGSGGLSYVKPGTLPESEVMDAIEDIDPGPWDKGTLRNMYRAATAAGVDDSVALQALKESVADDYVLGVRTKGPKRSTEDFIKYAAGRQATNGRSPKSLEDWKKFLTPGRATYRNPEQANYEAFKRSYGDLGPAQRGLPLSYDRGRSGGGEVSAAEAASVAPVTTTAALGDRLNALGIPVSSYEGDIPGVDFQRELERDIATGAITNTGSQAARGDVLRNLERALAAVPGLSGARTAVTGGRAVRQLGRELATPKNIQAATKTATKAVDEATELATKAQQATRLADRSNSTSRQIRNADKLQEQARNAAARAQEAERRVKALQDALIQRPGQPAGPMGPPKSGYWRNLERPSVTRADPNASALRQWLRDRGAFNPR